MKIPLLIFSEIIFLISCSFYQTAQAFPITVNLNELNSECKNSIYVNRPNLKNPKFPVDWPTVYKDWNGDLSIGWSRITGELYTSDTSAEMNASRAIGASCPSVAIVVFSGSTGGTERWYIRRNKFTIRHSRDSGYPGDFDKYWGWNKIPFNYNPQINYD